MYSLFATGGVSWGAGINLLSGNFWISYFNSPRPVNGCQVLKVHYQWCKDKTRSLSVSSIDDNVLTSTRNISQKSKIIDESELSTIAKKRNVGKGCHILA